MKVSSLVLQFQNINLYSLTRKKTFDIRMKLLLVTLLAIWTVRILSCGTVVQNGRRIQQFVDRQGKKTVDEALRLKRLGIDKIKEIEEREEQETDENMQVHSDYEDISDEREEQETDENVQRRLLIL